MERPIYIRTSTMKCYKCERELESGTTCYDYNDMILCEDCMDRMLELLKNDCEIEAEDIEEWY